ncbi:MAG: esterase/lipase family protein [Ilumatobacteraceae bacterium]
MTDTAENAPVAAPSGLLTVLEVRAVAERGAMTAALPLLRRLPPGDGHPVLVLPGFVAGDQSTEPLRRLLRSLNYRAFAWRLGRNLGPTPDIVAGMVRRFEEIHEKHGGPISLVGWSLGGIYARELGRRFPSAVRQVITLGSPIRMVAGDRSAASRTWDSLRPSHDPEVIDRRSIPEAEREPLAMPATSIYTRTDGIVHWSTCLADRGTRSENIEVYGSHCGLGYNTSALLAVADRLAQTNGDWRHFKAPFWLRAAFPPPANWEPGRRA